MNKHILAPLIAATILALAAHAVQAAGTAHPNLPPREGASFQERYSFQFDRHQEATSVVSIDHRRRVEVNTAFSNGKKIDGDNFFCLVILRDKADNPIAAIYQQIGLNAAGVKSAREGSVKDELYLSEREFAALFKVEVLFGTKDKVNDAEYGRAVAALGSAIFNLIMEKKVYRNPEYNS